MLEVEYQRGANLSIDTPTDIRNGIVSFMRLERRPSDFDCLSIQYLERFCAHMTIFRAFLSHFDLMQRDRLARLQSQHDELERSVINRVSPVVVRQIIEEVRARTAYDAGEGRIPHP